MAFKGRGSGPATNSGGSDKVQSQNYGVNRHTHINRIYLYSATDIWLTIFSFILLVGGIIFLRLVYGYKMTVFDPILDIKNTVMWIESFYVFVTFIFFTFSCLLCYDPPKVHKCIFAAVLFSCLMTISLFLVSTYLELTYTSRAFYEFYNDPVYTEKIGDIGANYFVEESLEGFKIFNLKNKINIFINLFIIALEIYFFNRTNKIVEKQARIRQYDEALFDDEINVKI